MALKLGPGDYVLGAHFYTAGGGGGGEKVIVGFYHNLCKHLVFELSALHSTFTHKF